jgi:hypothetical protein
MRTKNQHTVTRAYLERWGDAKAILHVYDVITGKARRENASNVTAQRYFYSGPDGEQEFEKALATLEGFWVRSQDEVMTAAGKARRFGRRGTKVIYKPDKEQLAHSVVQQWVRTERIRLMFGNLSPSEARDAHVELMVRADIIQLARQMEDGIWLVFARADEHMSMPLYTSDHPVRVIPLPSGAAPAGNRVKGFMFPLSPDHLLAIYARGTTQFRKEWDGRVIPLVPTLVSESNELQVLSAERVVISSTQDFDLARRLHTSRDGLERGRRNA